MVFENNQPKSNHLCFGSGNCFLVFKMMPGLVLKHETTCDPGLVFFGSERSCIMKNGDVVMYGKTSDNSPAEFHVYDSHKQKIKIFKQLCQQNRNKSLSLFFGNIEYLMVSCSECHKIHLYNMDTASVTEAWYDPRHKPGPMYHGPQSTVCVVDDMKGIPVLLLDSSTAHFQLKNTVQTNMEKYYDICYISTVNTMVLNAWDPSIIRAVSLTSQILWELTGSVGGASCDPHG